MIALRQHWARIAITFVPVVLALAHATGFWRPLFLDRLDNFIYDVRLRATMPRTTDPRIAIVDIDDSSLRKFGQWPWSRDKLARLSTGVTVRQQAAVHGFDVLFAEADASSGLDVLKGLANGSLRGDADFVAEPAFLAPTRSRRHLCERVRRPAGRARLLLHPDARASCGRAFASAGASIECLSPGP